MFQRNKNRYDVSWKQGTRRFIPPHAFTWHLQTETGLLGNSSTNTARIRWNLSEDRIVRGEGVKVVLNSVRDNLCFEQCFQVHSCDVIRMRMF